MDAMRDDLVPKPAAERASFRAEEPPWADARRTSSATPRTARQVIDGAARSALPLATVGQGMVVSAWSWRPPRSSLSKACLRRVKA